MDGVLVINELLDFVKRNKRVCLLVKVDFSIAYDYVVWEYLRDIMGRIKFGNKWVNWMEVLVYSSIMSVLVNGSPTLNFQVTRGFHQGNPISPFLF